MKNLITKNLLKMAVVGMNIIMLTACNGILTIYTTSLRRLYRLRDRW